MPIYVYECEPCKSTVEELQPMGTSELECPLCREGMSKLPGGAGVMTLMNGQYPSFRKRYLGTAPHTSNITGLEGKGGPGAKGQRAYMEGQKWLRSIE